MSNPMNPDPTLAGTTRPVVPAISDEAVEVADRTFRKVWYEIARDNPQRLVGDMDLDSMRQALTAALPHLCPATPAPDPVPVVTEAISEAAVNAALPILWAFRWTRPWADVESFALGHDVYRYEKDTISDILTAALPHLTLAPTPGPVPVTDAMVEAAAEAIWQDDDDHASGVRGQMIYDWEQHVGLAAKKRYRRIARSALEAVAMAEAVAQFRARHIAAPPESLDAVERKRPPGPPVPPHVPGRPREFA